MNTQALNDLGDRPPAVDRLRRPPRPNIDNPVPKQPGSEKTEGATTRPSPSLETMEIAAEQMNDVMGAFNKDLRFQVNRDTEQMYVQVIDSATRKVVRTIPPERMMNLMSRVHEVLGLIFDEQG